MESLAPIAEIATIHLETPELASSLVAYVRRRTHFHGP
jgi:hypothetical protein